MLRHLETPRARRLHFMPIILSAPGVLDTCHYPFALTLSFFIYIRRIKKKRVHYPLLSPLLSALKPSPPFKMLLVFPPSLPAFPARSSRRRRHSPPPPPAASLSSPSSSSGDVDAFTKYSGYIFEGGASSEAELSDEYDIRKIAAIYRRRPVLVARRFAQIGTVFGRWFALRYLDSVLERSDDMFKVGVIFYFENFLAFRV